MKRLVIGSVPPETWKQVQKWGCECWIHDQKNLARHGETKIWKLLAFCGILEKYCNHNDNYWWSKFAERFRRFFDEFRPVN